MRSLLDMLAEREAEREDLAGWMADLGSMTSDEAAAYRSEFEGFASATDADGVEE